MTIAIVSTVAAVATHYANPEVAALNDGIALYKDGDYEAARDRLADYKGNDPWTRFVELASRTAATPPPVQKPNEFTREIEAVWDDLEFQWQAVAERTPYKKEALYNLHLVYLENDSPLESNIALQKAIEAGLDRSVCLDSLELLQLSADRTKENPDVDRYATMTAKASELSRGQFVALLSAIQFARGKTNGIQKDRLDELRSDLLDIICQPGSPVEPGIITGHYSVLSKDERVLELRRRKMAGETVESRLGRFLMFPEEFQMNE